MSQQTIFFDKIRGKKYGQFSNLASRKIEIDGKSYPTAEHYFQSKKYEGKTYKEFIRVASGKRGRDATRYGTRKGESVQREDWEQVKDSIMETAVMAKFTQHHDLMQLLLDTGCSEIVYDSPTDYYWGIGSDGMGKNMLGRILMKVRWEIATSVH